VRAIHALPAAAVLAAITWLVFWRPAPPAKHVILISIDTLRADHLGCYGYARATTPAIDSFAAGAVRFATAIAHAPSTLPSHASMLTSLVPQHHGASFHDRSAIAPGVTTLTELLREHGFRTASWNGGGQIDGAFGMGRGFEIYERQDPENLGANVDRALEWLDSEISERDRFFLFLHTYEVHHPYTPTEELLARFEEGYSGSLPGQITIPMLRELNAGEELTLDAADVQHIVDTYDAEILGMDRSFARLLEELQRRNLLRDTMIVFTSGHGEEFAEHGRVGWHSHTLYDELLRVPLIVRHGGSRDGSVVQEQVRLIDVAPTILEGLGLEPYAGFRGRSLFALAHGQVEETERAAISWRDRGFSSPEPENTSIRTIGWKLWDERLFDLKLDPGETQERSFDEPMRADRLAEMRDRLLAEAERPPATFVAPDDEIGERLGTLGYVD